MTKDEALKLALEAMRGLYGGWRCESAIKACEEALAQPEQEPKCGAIIEVFGKDWRLDYMSLPVGKHKLYTQQYTYTTPPQSKPLTDEMRKQMKERCDSMEMRGAFADGWLSAEAAHGIKEKNT